MVIHNVSEKKKMFPKKILSQFAIDDKVFQEDQQQFTILSLIFTTYLPRFRWIHGHNYCVIFENESRVKVIEHCIGQLTSHSRLNTSTWITSSSFLIYQLLNYRAISTFPSTFFNFSTVRRKLGIYIINGLIFVNFYYTHTYRRVCYFPVSFRFIYLQIFKRIFRTVRF